MKVTEITVSDGRTFSFSHPSEGYSNLQPHVCIKAKIEKGEDWEKAVKKLQLKASVLVEEQKEILIGVAKMKYKSLGGNEWKAADTTDEETPF